MSTGEGVGAFNHLSEDIEAYLFRLDAFLKTKSLRHIPTPAALAADANAAAVAAHNAALQTARDRDEDRCSWLIRVAGTSTVQLLWSLCAPDRPDTKTFNQLCDLLRNHFRGSRNKHALRQQFNACKQASGETVTVYAAKLREKALYCQFNAFLEDALVTQFRNGLASTAVKNKLLDDYANFNELVTAASDLEDRLGAPSVDVNYVFKKKGRNWQGNTQQKNAPSHPPGKPTKKQSGRGGRPRPERPISSSEPVQGTRCFNCNGRGHFSKNCPSPRRQRTGNVNAIGSGNGDRPEVVQEDADAGRGAVGAIDLYYIDARDRDPEKVYVDVALDGKLITMILDTGSTKASLIGKPLFDRCFRRPLRPTAPLGSCTSEPLDLLGEFTVNVRVGEAVADLPLVVVNGPFPSLFGLPWARKLYVDWMKMIADVNFVSSPTLSTPEFIEEMKKKFPNAFGSTPGVIKDFEVNIRIKPGATPVCFSARTIPYAMMELAKKELDAMEEKGYLKKVSGPGQWGTPIVLVRKANNAIRLCGDYKVSVNTLTERGHFSLPTIDELSTIEGAWFCSLDFSEAFQQLRLSAESRKILALSTPWGNYEPQTLQYGVNVAPEEFQAKVTEILQGIGSTFIYLDNVLVWGMSRAGCMRVAETVLQRLDDYNVRLNQSKCEWLVESVKFLGFVLDRNGMRPDPSRIKALRRLRVPTNAAELKSFIGHVTFYCKFAENLSTLIHPLHQLVNSSEWCWTAEHQSAYDDVLGEIGNSVLVPYSLSLPLRLTCDASLVGVGAVIAHLLEDGSERPIAFASKTLSEAERNYPQHEKEALALVFGIKKFTKYLLNRDFEIFSDNRAITAIFGPTSKQRPATAARLLRWKLLLRAFRYKIVYARGTDIPHADHLSRMPEMDATPVESTVNYVGSLEESFVPAAEVAAETAKDPVMGKVYFYVQHGWPDEISAELKPFKDHEHDLSSLNGCVLRGNKVIIPPTLRPAALRRLHDMHPGISTMKSLARSYVWWPDVDHQIEALVAECAVCQKLHRNIPHDPYVPWTWAPRRWQRIFADFADYRGHRLFVVIDHHSKWPEVRIMPSLRASDVCEALRGMFATWGLPEQFVSDNGPPFQSAEFHEFLTAHQIEHVKSPVYHPPSNGPAERLVCNIKTGLDKQEEDPKTRDRTMQHKIDAWLFYYRNRPHSTTKLTPGELFLGRKPRTLLSAIHPSQALKSRMRSAADRTAALRPRRRDGFSPGDPVWIKRLEQGKVRWTPGVIESLKAASSCMVQDGSRVRHLSTSFLRHRRGESPDADPVDSPGETSAPEPQEQLAAPVPAQHIVPVLAQPIQAALPPVVSPPEGNSTPTPSRPTGSTPERGPSETPRPRTLAPRVSSPAPATPRKTVPVPAPPITESPVRAPTTVTRSGRTIVPPKRLNDFVPK